MYTGQFPTAALTINSNHRNIRSVYPAVTLQFTTKYDIKNEVSV